MQGQSTTFAALPLSCDVALGPIINIQTHGLTKFYGLIWPSIILIPFDTLSYLALDMLNFCEVHLKNS